MVDSFLITPKAVLAFPPSFAKGASHTFSDESCASLRWFIVPQKYFSPQYVNKPKLTEHFGNIKNSPAALIEPFFF
jgi:hypothetical protein